MNASSTLLTVVKLTVKYSSFAVWEETTENTQQINTIPNKTAHPLHTHRNQLRQSDTQAIEIKYSNNMIIKQNTTKSQTRYYNKKNNKAKIYEQPKRETTKKGQNMAQYFEWQTV